MSVHASLRAAGATVVVWRPSQLEEIARTLSRHHATTKENH